MYMTRTMGVPVQLRRGVLAGTAAWIAAVVVVHGVLRSGTVFPEILVRFMEEAPIMSTTGAMLDAHAWFVGIRLSADIAPLVVVPIVLLLAAGYWTASGGGGTSPVGGILGGASVVAGYLAMLIVTVVLMTLFGGGSGGETGMETILMLVVTGVVYPVVLGGLGGLVASQLGRPATGTASTAE